MREKAMKTRTLLPVVAASLLVPAAPAPADDTVDENARTVAITVAQLNLNHVSRAYASTDDVAAMVHVKDLAQNPIGGATVTVTWQVDLASDGLGAEDADGIVVDLETSAEATTGTLSGLAVLEIPAERGVYTITITGVDKAGGDTDGDGDLDIVYEYDAAAGITTATLSLPWRG